MGYIISGGNIDPQITPMRVQSVGGDASFFILPVRMVDQEHHINTPGVAVNTNFRFTTAANQITQKLVDNTEVAVPNQPQWKTDVNPNPFYSMQHVSFEGDGTPTIDFPALFAWRAITPSTVWGMERPPIATERFMTFRVNIAESADLTTILGSALFTLRWTRA